MRAVPARNFRPLGHVWMKLDGFKVASETGSGELLRVRAPDPTRIHVILVLKSSREVVKMICAKERSDLKLHTRASHMKLQVE